MALYPNLEASTSSKSLTSATELLAIRHKRVAFVESATAGFLMTAFATTAHGSVLAGGIVCYDAAIKTGLLGVPEALITQYTPESLPVTQAITAGLKRLMDADYYIGITGLLKPGGSQRPDKPVGTIYLALLDQTTEYAAKRIFTGTPRMIQEKTLEWVCLLIIETLSMPHL